MGVSTFDEHSVQTDQLFLDSTTTTVFQAISGFPDADNRIDCLLLTSNSATPHVVELAMDIGGLKVPLGQVTVPALAGTPGVPAVDAVALLAPAAVGGFILQAGHNLFGRVTVTLTGGDTILGLAMGGKF